MTDAPEPESTTRHKFQDVVETFGKDELEILIAKARRARLNELPIVAGSGDVQVQVTPENMDFRVKDLGWFCLRTVEAELLISPDQAS